MFAEIKKAALVAATIHLTGVLGHGFVKQLTIDGVVYVYYIFASLRIQNSCIFFLAATLV